MGFVVLQSAIHRALPQSSTVSAVLSNAKAATIKAARVPDDLYRAACSMLAMSSRRLICLNTPFGKSGFFSTTNGRRETTGSACKLQRINVRASRLNFSPEENRSLPDAWFRQEYLCEFAGTDGAVLKWSRYSHDYPSRRLISAKFCMRCGI